MPTNYKSPCITLSERKAKNLFRKKKNSEVRVSTTSKKKANGLHGVEKEPDIIYSSQFCLPSEILLYIFRLRALS